MTVVLLALVMAGGMVVAANCRDTVTVLPDAPVTVAVFPLMVAVNPAGKV
jgi:hypothetical protein